MNPIPPDEHLLKALRHAPDAELAAPPELSAQILAAAHRSAGGTPRAAAPPLSTWARWKLRWWTAPGASAAFATVLMAGFIGLLWRGEVPGPGTDEPAVREVAAPAPLVKPAVPAAAPAPAAPGTAADLPNPAVPASSPRARPETAKGPAQRMRAPEAGPQDSARQGRQAADTAATPPPLAAAPEAPPAPPAAMAAPPPATAPAPAEAAADRAQHTRLSAGAQRAESPAAPARALPVPLRMAPAGPASAKAASGPMVHEDDVWSWQNPGPRRNPDGAWVQALIAAAEGQWTPVADPTPAPGAPAFSGWRAGVALGRVWVEPESVLWCPVAASCQRAPLQATFVRNWLAALAR